MGASLTLNGNIFAGGSVGGGVYIDHNGKFVFTTSKAGAAGHDLQAGGTLSLEWSYNLDSVDDLSGKSVFTGFSGPFFWGTSLGYTHSYNGDNSTNAISLGRNFKFSKGFIPYQITGGVSNTEIKKETQLDFKW